MDQSTLNALAGALASSQKANSTMNRGTMAGGQYVPPSGLGWAGNAAQAFAPALQAYLKRQQMMPQQPTPQVQPNNSIAQSAPAPGYGPVSQMPIMPDA